MDIRKYGYNENMDIRKYGYNGNMGIMEIWV